MSAEPSLADILSWDVRSWSTAVTYWDEHVDWQRVHTCLEVGAGDGGLSLWLSRKGKQVTCSDLSGVEARARPHHEAHGLAKQITYRDLDATNLGFEDTFDLVVFKSILGGIGRHGGAAAQRRAIAEMYKALRPGGVLLFAENLVGSPIHTFLRRRFVRWGATWRYVTTTELAQFLQSFSGVELLTTGVMAALGRSERQRELLARIDRAGLNTVVPARWRYIAYGIARK